MVNWPTPSSSYANFKCKYRPHFGKLANAIITIAISNSNNDHPFLLACYFFVFRMHFGLNQWLTLFSLYGGLNGFFLRFSYKANWAGLNFQFFSYKQDRMKN